MTFQTKLPVSGTDFWMEIKFVLGPDEYRILRKEAALQSLNTSELVQQIILQWIKKNNS